MEGKHQDCRRGTTGRGEYTAKTLFRRSAQTIYVRQRPESFRSSLGKSAVTDLVSAERTARLDSSELLLAVFSALIAHQMCNHRLRIHFLSLQLM
ncbi:hypothetical protein R1flu_011375 [Riccia fluitans]|uniref:Uncharacterized protein n=1 Tax=Riccia fluitans TaxID=41844 RepID=A0ABD1Z8N8_9MARC